MVQFKVGDTITLCASIRDWCSETNYYQLYDINCTIGTCNITIIPYWTCLSPSGIQLEFQWVDTRNHIAARDCLSHTLRVLGTGYTSPSGVVSLVHTIDQTDLDLYNANQASFELRVCIKNTPYVYPTNAGEIRSATSGHSGDYITIIPNLCAGISCNDICIGNDLYWQTCDPLTGNCIQGALKEAGSVRCLPATHSVGLQLGLVPAGLVQYFSQYITDISDNLIPWMVANVPGFAFPANWEYLRTEYDQQTNAFKIMMHYYGTLSLSANDYIDSHIDNHYTNNINNLDIGTDLGNLWYTINIYKFAILAGIIALVAVVLILTAGLTWYVALWLIGAVTILAFDIITLSTQVKELEQKVKNAETIVGQQDKETGQIIIIDDTWNSSPKAKPDCLARLEKLRDLHKRIINGYAEQFNNVVSIVNAMKTEDDTFTTDTVTIIGQFNANPDYSTSICDSYYATLRNKIDLSNARINDIISTKAPGGSEGDYVPPVLCSDHTTQAECEAAGCVWDNGICKAKECAIPSPLGGCLLYKETATDILVFGAALLFGIFALGIVSRGPPRRE